MGGKKLGFSFLNIIHRAIIPHSGTSIHPMNFCFVLFFFFLIFWRKSNFIQIDVDDPSENFPIFPFLCFCIYKQQLRKITSPSINKIYINYETRRPPQKKAATGFQSIFRLFFFFSLTISHTTNQPPNPIENSFVFFP